MEIANLDNAAIRVATTRDAPRILRLLQEAAYTHIHADWHAPGDWIGSPGFVVSERAQVANSLSGFGRRDDELEACLAATADPYPAAWVRVAAMLRMAPALETLAGMLEVVVPHLRDSGATILAWLAVESWPDNMLPLLGFRRANWITTFLKEGLDMPPVLDSGVLVRPVRPKDMETLAAIEAEAFDPLWRHSAAGLKLAHGYSICFDVAEVNGEIVGFQYSAANHNQTGAHLVRITVRPGCQGYGVGSALMKSAVEHYRSRGIKRVSLNTQINNTASHKLYEKFGFFRTGDQLPVWVKELAR